MRFYAKFNFLLIVLLVFNSGISAENHQGTKYKSSSGELDSILQLSDYYFDSNPENAIQICLYGISLARNCNDTSSIVKLTSLLGRAYVLTGQFTKGLEHLRESENLASDLGLKREEAFSLLNQGNVFFFNNLFIEALPYYKEALVLSSEIKDSVIIAGSLHNIGLCYNKGYNDQDSALIYLRQSLSICVALEDTNRILFTYSNIGGNYMDADEYDTALEYLEKSIVKEGAYLNKTVYSYVLAQIGEIYFHWNEYNRSEGYVLKGYRIAEKINAYYTLNKTTDLLARLYAAKKDYKKAFYFSNQSRILNDSINTTELKDQLAFLRIQHKLNKKDQEVKFLTIQNELAEIRSKKQAMQRNLAFALLLLLFILIVLGIKQYRIQKKFNQKLKKEVEGKTKELAQALERAERSDELKTKFLQNMSHEVRTPLNAIQGFSELLTETADSKNQLLLDYVAVIRKNSDYLLELFENITDLSRLENDDFILIPEQFKLVEFIDKLTTEFQGKANELYNGKLKLTKRIAPEIGIDFTINQDYNNLRKVLYILLDNALKATLRGEIKLEVEYSDDNLSFNISDTGHGILEEYRDQIFEKFQKISYRENKFFRGAGLGLPIARLIVEKMHGVIEFESKVGIGSKFVVKVPSSLKRV